MATWDPQQYLKFSDHRLRPALDLMARIPAIEARTVYDLGCGPGNITRMLAERWPAAR
jgi:trans-aconitate 2-methyltransferase